MTTTLEGHRLSPFGPNEQGSIASRLAAPLAAYWLGADILGCNMLSRMLIEAQPPTPGWGVMSSDGRNYITTQWWLTAVPAGRSCCWWSRLIRWITVCATLEPRLRSSTVSFAPEGWQNLEKNSIFWTKEKHQSIGLLYSALNENRSFHLDKNYGSHHNRSLTAKSGLNRWIFSRCTQGVPRLFAVRSGF